MGRPKDDGSEPNNWESILMVQHGNLMKPLINITSIYLVKQPDLNWDNLKYVNQYLT